MITKYTAKGLYIAACHGNIRYIKRAYEAGINLDIYIKEYSYQTPLMCAALNKQHVVIKWLVEHGADINATNQQDRTAIFFSSYAMDDEAISYLIANNAKVNIQDKFDTSPIHFSVARNHLTGVQLLKPFYENYSYGSFYGSERDGVSAFHARTPKQIAKIKGFTEIEHFLENKNNTPHCDFFIDITHFGECDNYDGWKVFYGIEIDIDLNPFIFF